MTRWALSPGQDAIWFEEQLQQGTGNTGFFSVTLVGDLAEELVASACEAVVRRHAPIRTVVRVVDDQPFLSVLPATAALTYETVDVPCAPGEEVAITSAWRDRCGKQHFDLFREPSVAFALLRHGPGRRTLLVVAHHLCYDGRSKFVFGREFATALTALRSGETPAASPLPWPAWPAADDQSYERAREYWNAVDIVSCAPLRLPHGEPSGATVGTIGERIVDGQTRQRLRELAATSGTNLFGALLATLAVTLYGYGNTRMVLCVPVDVTTPQTRDLIGLGVNVVPVVLSLDGEDTFVSALAKAGAARSRLMDFRLVPFRLLSAGKAWSAGSRALFSRIALSYMRMATDVPDVPGLDSTWNFMGHNSARTFDLMFHIRDAHDRIVIRLDFSGSDIDAVAATTVADHVSSVLSQVLARPSTPLRALPLLPADGVVTSRADVPVISGGAEHPLVALCAQQAARAPDRRAVAGPGGFITYRELADLCPAEPTRSGIGDGVCATFPDLVARIRALGSAEPRDGLRPTAAPCGQPAAALRWQARRLDLGADVRMLQLASPGSAEFWQECWLTWTAGGTLYVLGAPVTGASVRSALIEHAITTMVAPYHVLRRVAGTGLAPSLTHVITPLGRLRPSAEILALVRSGVRLYAQYVHDRAGVVAMESCTPTRLASGDAPVLRDLVNGIRISVCRPDGWTLPRGVAGHLVVETPLGAGGEDGGWARHATGDLGEVDRCGALLYHGASGDTVEWAGQSLNIPSLERHLAMHPKVEEVVVVAREHRAAAYLVPRAGTDLDVRQARLHLRQRSVRGELRLSQVCVVPALPRLSDGDVDRRRIADRQWDEKTRSWQVSR